MFESLKNMFRRKTRTVLTIFGITIGIFAFTVMGSMAEKINSLVNGGTRYFADKVIVRAEGTSLFTLPTPMNIDKAQEIAKVPGVAAVSSNVYLTLSDNTSTFTLGPPAAIFGSDFAGQSFESFKVTYSSGHGITNEDTGQAVVGADVVKKLNAKVGGTIEVRDHTYEVAGILNKTLTAPDNQVWLTLPDSQQLLDTTLPQVVREQNRPSQLVNGFTAYPESGVNPNTLATKVSDEVDGITASGPQEFQDQIANTTGIFNAILFGVAFISLLVGGLSVINTMTMSISERTREIGIKKALGAKTRSIMREYLTEAALIGLFGGLLGLALGAATVWIINRATEDSGNIVFLLTPRLAIAAVVFATLLGILAGIYPAYHAAKINIVQALRER